MEHRARVTVAMLGARMHYAVPRMLYRSGMLEHFFTDSYAGNKPILSKMLRSIPSHLAPRGLRRWIGRQAPDLPSNYVTSFELLGMFYAFLRSNVRRMSQRERVFAFSSRHFARASVRRGLGSSNIVYGFNTASVEIFAHAKNEKQVCVLEQTILPSRLQEEILTAVWNDWPDWQPGFHPPSRDSLQRRRETEEWELADHIVAGSTFVRDGLLACSVPSDKVSVIPYGIDLEWSDKECHKDPGGRPLRILFAGEVGLRKGAPYLLEALRRIGPKLVQGRFAGDLALDPLRLQPYRDVADFLGAVPRIEMRSLFNWADVFVLPSAVEGSATVTYEALLSGLPLIVTPNCGSIITGGDAGIVVPIRDIDAIESSLMAYIEDPTLLRHHSEGAVALRSYAGMDRYRSDLEKLMYRLMEMR